jgi:hypothetical protein
MTAFAAIGDDGGAGASKQAQQLVAGHRSGYTLLLIIPEVISWHRVTKNGGFRDGTSADRSTGDDVYRAAAASSRGADNPSSDKG